MRVTLDSLTFEGSPEELALFLRALGTQAVATVQQSLSAQSPAEAAPAAPKRRSRKRSPKPLQDGALLSGPALVALADALEARCAGGRLLLLAVAEAGPDGLLAAEGTRKAGLPTRRIGPILSALRGLARERGQPIDALLRSRREAKGVRLVLPLQSAQPDTPLQP